MLNRLICSLGIFLLISLFGFSSFAVTTYDYNTSIVGVGCSTGSVCYMEVASNPQNCIWGIIFFPDTSVSSQAQYATAMMAYSMGKTMRIAYTGGAGGTCTVAGPVATPG